MIRISAPPTSVDQRKRLLAHKSGIDSVIAGVQSGAAKLNELRAKEEELRNEVPSLQRDAANFLPGAELKLLSNQQTLDRLRQAIKQAESECSQAQQRLFPAIDQAQELVCSLCQPCHEELLDRICVAVSPFVTAAFHARQFAQQTSASRDLVYTLLTRGVSSMDSVQRLSDYAKDVIKRIEALVNESEIWSYEGLRSFEPRTSAGRDFRFLKQK